MNYIKDKEDKKMKNIIEVNYETDYIEDFTDNVFFNQGDQFELSEVIEKVVNVRADYGFKRVPAEKYWSSLIIDLFGNEKKFLKEFKDYWDLEEDEEIDETYKLEFYEFMNNQALSMKEYTEKVDKALDPFNFEVGTVGYSQWSWTIYPKGQRHLAVDLWDGTNFYTLSHYKTLEDQELDHIDSVGFVYAPTEKDLHEAIKYNFDVVDYVLVDDDITSHWKHEKTKLKTLTKRYENI